MSLRLVVCGPADWTAADAVFRVLEELARNHGVPALIAVDETVGVSLLARAWAIYRGVPVSMWQAPYPAHGPRAPTLRNRAMLEFVNPELVVFLARSGSLDENNADLLRLAQKQSRSVLLCNLD